MIILFFSGAVVGDRRSRLLTCSGSGFVAQERVPIEEVFEQLKCTREGLSSEEGANRLQIFGPNKLEEKKVFFF